MEGAYDFGYDDLYRLVSSDAPGTSKDESFGYDPAGNRTSAWNAAGAIDHNANNQTLTYGPDSFEYDANGNTVKMISPLPLGEGQGEGKLTRVFTWDAENRLIKVEEQAGAVIATYGYDPFGRRLWKEAKGVKTFFLYSDEGLIGEFDSSGNEIKSYGWKPGGTWGTDPVFMQKSGQYYFYHNDHLGTPRMMTSVTGNVVWKAEYEAFGKADVTVGVIENNLRFPGQYYDEETGLHYNWFRFYDPSTGRYLTPDPIGLAGGVNLFAYSLNNPINYLDPFGLHTIVVCTDTHQVEIFDDDGNSVYKEKAVTGCPDHDTLEGEFVAGDWIKDKTNPKYGPRPWSEDKTNPYGPWFLPVNRQDGTYTTIGIHGTAGPGWSPFVKPPFAEWWSDPDDYLYCSHGCVRQSNPDIIKMHDILPKPKGTPIIIKKCK